jgi:hypothetical protein
MLFVDLGLARYDNEYLVRTGRGSNTAIIYTLRIDKLNQVGQLFGKPQDTGGNYHQIDNSGKACVWNIG